MGISLLERLARKHKKWVVDLTIQVSLATFLSISNLILVPYEQGNHEFEQQIDLQEQA
jgi:hypothetical protein